MLIFILLFFTTFFAFTFSEFMHLVGTTERRETRVIEGKVESYSPETLRSKAEHFCVRDTCFTYSEAVITGSFHMPASVGGPVRPGLGVRITYIHETDLRALKEEAGWNNKIVRLEIADEPDAIPVK